MHLTAEETGMHLELELMETTQDDADSWLAWQNTLKLLEDLPS